MLSYFLLNRIHVILCCIVGFIFGSVDVDVLEQNGILVKSLEWHLSMSQIDVFVSLAYE